MNWKGMLLKSIKEESLSWFNLIKMGLNAHTNSLFYEGKRITQGRPKPEDQERLREIDTVWDKMVNKIKQTFPESTVNESPSWNQRGSFYWKFVRLDGGIVNAGKEERAQQSRISQDPEKYGYPADYELLPNIPFNPINEKTGKRRAFTEVERREAVKEEEDEWFKTRPRRAAMAERWKEGTGYGQDDLGSDIGNNPGVSDDNRFDWVRVIWQFGNPKSNMTNYLMDEHGEKRYLNPTDTHHPDGSKFPDMLNIHWRIESEELETIVQSSLSEFEALGFTEFEAQEVDAAVDFYGPSARDVSAFEPATLDDVKVRRKE